MKLLIITLALALAGCAQVQTCFIAHSPSVETSDGTSIPSRTTKVCSGYVEMVQ